MQSLESGAVLLTASDLDRLLTVELARDAVRDAFLLLGRGAAEPPVAAGVHVPGGGFHWKAALWPGPPPRFVAKLNANFPGNPARGLPTIQGHVAVLDAVDGTLLALLESGIVTARRTAAATALAADHLARPGASRLALIGCGVQGAEHIPALAAVRPLESVRLVDTDPDRAARLAHRCREAWGLDAAATDLVDATRDADMIVTVTPARAPIVDASMVRAGAFVAGVGADWPEKHELAVDLLARATVVPDLLRQALTMGDLHHAVSAGALTREHVTAELGDIVAGRHPGRRHDDEIIVFDSTGMALQDAAVAVRVLA